MLQEAHLVDWFPDKESCSIIWVFVRKSMDTDLEMKSKIARLKNLRSTIGQNKEAPPSNQGYTSEETMIPDNSRYP